MNTSSNVLICYSILGLCVIFACTAPVNAAREEASGSIQQALTPEEFKAAALSKLSSQELEKLTAWLHGYREVAEMKATDRTEKVEHTQNDMLVPRAAGTFS